MTISTSVSFFAIGSTTALVPSAAVTNTLFEVMGVPSEISDPAAAIVVFFRVISYWLPILPCWLAYRYVQKHDLA